MKKGLRLAITATAVLWMACSSPLPDSQQMKRDLLGHSVTSEGRGWKFGSLSEFQEFTVSKTTHEKDIVENEVTMVLRDGERNKSYRMGATIVYRKSGGTWELISVSSNSLVRLPAGSAPANRLSAQLEVEADSSLPLWARDAMAWFGYRAEEVQLLHRHLALQAVSRNELDVAIKEYKKAGASQDLMQMGLLYAQLGKYSDAYDAFLIAYERAVPPENEELALLVMTALRGAAKYQECTDFGNEVSSKIKHPKLDSLRSLCEFAQKCAIARPADVASDVIRFQAAGDANVPEATRKLLLEIAAAIREKNTAFLACYTGDAAGIVEFWSRVVAPLENITFSSRPSYGDPQTVFVLSDPLDGMSSCSLSKEEVYPTGWIFGDCVFNDGH